MFVFCFLSYANIGVFIQTTKHSPDFFCIFFYCEQGVQQRLRWAVYIL